MLSQLIYLSTRNPNYNSIEMEKILKKSRTNNRKKNITGVLLYSRDKFLQVLEGEYLCIKSLYKVIQGDERHIEPTLISFTSLQTKNFPYWEMGARDIDDEETYKMSNIDREVLQKEFRAILKSDAIERSIIKIINTLF